jgi:hypothetical protein
VKKEVYFWDFPINISGLGACCNPKIKVQLEPVASPSKMSLYANINVSKTQEEAAAVKRPLVKTSKSAALYAGVLAKPPPPKESVPVQTSPQSIPQPAEVEVEKPSEASGTNSKSSKDTDIELYNSSLQFVEFRK